MNISVVFLLSSFIAATILSSECKLPTKSIWKTNN